jgi:GNAT superfamily N-acetyltransferase
LGHRTFAGFRDGLQVCVVATHICNPSHPQVRETGTVREMATVREADERDLEALVALRRQSAAERGLPEESGFEQRFREWFEREAGHRVFWLAEDDGSAVGAANLMLFDRMPNPGMPSGGWGYLGNMYVLPSHRDHGVGGKLLAAIADHADARGLERIVLNPSTRAVPFYARAGFESAVNLMLRPNRNGPDDSH